MSEKTNYYLFSIDLEDVRDFIPNGSKYRDAVTENILLYLQWLDKHQSKATFFCVGIAAEKNADLIKEISNRGHEIACHTHLHQPLTTLQPDTFRADIEKNLQTLYKAGAKEITGFRAPTFSLTKNCEWVYEILHSLNFKYSSSVLPAKNPLYGWEHFGSEKFMNGVYEIPMNIGMFPFRFPFGGGVYFRVLPIPLLRLLFKNAFSNDKTVLGYFHPYDADVKQEKFMHPNINNNFLYNELMYVGRKNLFLKLNSIMKTGCKIIRYDEYVNRKTKNQ